ncbi:hypothetical protein SRB17_85880 [Streptomyces sp. RB17]|uniref:hypothetical protein n=1 Tax=Streptomyces sp. RB17 TaxID=2585197 RepID=UPI00130576B9|nr:hypothetical protein [Streptomyces sp. RB17]MQY40555.1 hypothetical protein [Streptomyces sp. RB17]
MPAQPNRPLQDLCDDMLYRLHNDTRDGDVVLLLARTHPFPADQLAAWDIDYHLTAVATRPQPASTRPLGSA